MNAEREMTLDEFIAAKLPKMHGAALELAALKAERDAAVEALVKLSDDSVACGTCVAIAKAALRDIDAARGEK